VIVSHRKQQLYSTNTSSVTNTITPPFAPPITMLVDEPDDDEAIGV